MAAMHRFATPARAAPHPGKRAATILYLSWILKLARSAAKSGNDKPACVFTVTDPGMWLPSETGGATSTASCPESEEIEVTPEMSARFHEADGT
jgi:hypothetical protein